MEYPNTWQLMTAAITGFTFPTGGCIYCGSTSEFYEQDHFPVPREFGGTNTVRTCRHCHNMKDRVSGAIANDLLLSCDAARNVILSLDETAFLCETASLLPTAANRMMSDWADFPASLRIAFARRLREQLRAIHAEVKRHPAMARALMADDEEAEEGEE